jgi:hypothetical protein
VSILGACCVGVCAFYVLYVGPLVDEEGLVAILEPRQVAQPREVNWNRAVTTLSLIDGISTL